MAFFSAANPSMELGGFIESSKSRIMQAINSEMRPKMVVVNQEKADEVIAKASKAGISLPFIAKPDMGERGYGVELIHNEQELANYLRSQSRTVIIQEFINSPMEFGIMYHRMPGQSRGVISSIVQKKYLTVVGDGASSIEMLIRKGRARLYYDLLQDAYHDELDTVLSHGQERVLVPFGNHVRGATFLDANHLITSELEAIFDEIAREIPGYYFGRFDIRVANPNDLYHPERLNIIELNGANSEPAHIYQPGFSIWQAYADLFKHWTILYQVSVANHKKGVPYMNTRKAWGLIFGHFSVRRQEMDLAGTA
jgi:hypothetical protein